MELEDYDRFFRDLSSLSCLHLTLTGGEPLVHPQFFEIAAKARELGFVLRIKSNGHALRGRMLERLKEEIDPFVVEVSLHGAHAESHDRQTRVTGSFDRLLRKPRADAGARSSFQDQQHPHPLERVRNRGNVRARRAIRCASHVRPRRHAPRRRRLLAARDRGHIGRPSPVVLVRKSPTTSFARAMRSFPPSTPRSIAARGRLGSPWTPSGTSIRASSGGGRSEISTTYRSGKSGPAIGSSRKSAGCRKK